MNRRGFLGAILAAGVAPVIVKASSLMKVSSSVSSILEIPSQEILLLNRGGVINAASFKAVLWPGVNKWYRDLYSEIDPYQL